MALEKNTSIWTRINLWILDKLTDGAVFIYRFFKGNKTMADQNLSGNGQKDQMSQEAMRKAKVTMSPASHDARFSDFAQIILSPTHGLIRFGLRQPGTDEYVVHTQIVMPPQALTGFAEGLKQQIEKIKEQQKKQDPETPTTES